MRCIYILPGDTAVGDAVIPLCRQSPAPSPNLSAPPPVMLLRKQDTNALKHRRCSSIKQSGYAVHYTHPLLFSTPGDMARSIYGSRGGGRGKKSRHFTRGIVEALPYTLRLSCTFHDYGSLPSPCFPHFTLFCPTPPCVRLMPAHMPIYAWCLVPQARDGGRREQGQPEVGRGRRSPRVSEDLRRRGRRRRAGVFCFF